MNISNKYLKAWLSFNTSPTEDAKLNDWQTFGNPTISETNAINGKALQLDGQSYLKLSGVELGGQNFYIDGWVFVDSSSPANARILHIVNSAGYVLLSVRKSSSDATKLDFWINSTADVSKDNGYTVTSTATSVGARVHFKLLYRYDNQRIFLYINDGNAVYRASVPKFTRQTFDIYIGAVVSGGQGLIGSVDELRIYDGTYLASGNNTPPTAADYQSITFSVDVERRIKIPASTWRYENSGTADLLSSSGTTLTNLPASQSKTGSAFYQTTRAKCFDIPATKEIWLKFDVYFDGANRWRAYNENSDGINGICSYVGYSYDFGIWQNGNRVKDFANVCKANQLQSILLHMTSDSSAGIIEAWVDGKKIYSYTGNVNNGDDFADIYLQSDGAGTFFSNVIISNAEIKLGEGYHKINFDLQRNLRAPVTFTVDLERVITQSHVLTVTENEDGHFYQKFFEGDEYGNPPYEYFEVENNVTDRIVFPARDEIWLCFSCWVNGNVYDEASKPIYKIFCGDEEHASGFAAGTTIDYENLLINGVAEPMQYDESWTDDEGYFVHFLLHLKSGVDDGLVEVKICELMFDYLTEYPVYSATGNVNNGEPLTEIFMLLHSEEQLVEGENFAEAWGIVASDKAIDIRGNLIPETVQLALNFDTERLVVCVVDFNCDLERRMPHRLIITPIEPPVRTKKLLRAATSLTETEGVQSLTITLAAQQLTDQLSVTWINPADIMEQIKGKYLDYEFDMRIEETTQRGILRTCQCCSDIDELLYTQQSYTIGRSVFQGGLYYDTSKFSASGKRKETTVEKSHVAASAHVMKIADFLDMQINCYIRNDTLYVIQRGYESNVIDLTDTKHTVPVIDKEIMRTIWGSTPGTETVIDKYTENDLGSKISDNPDEPKTEDWVAYNRVEEIDTAANHTTITNTYGEGWVLVSVSEVTQSKIDDSSSEKITDYFYDSFGYDGQNFLVKTVTTYGEHKDGKLVESTETVKENKYTFIKGDDGNLERAILTVEASSVFDNLKGNYTDYSVITHAFLAQGQREVHRTSSDGGTDGVSSPTPYTDELTPFEMRKNATAGKDQMQKSSSADTYRGWYTYKNGEKYEITGRHEVKDELTVEGIYLYDSSFPVEGKDKLLELTEAVKWLNRKTQETITMEIYDLKHVIDFNDRIIFNGNEYFLESNTIEKTPRIVNKQTVQLVRWY